MKSAPSSRQVSAAQKRSKSPEPSKRVVKSSVVDQKARREQIGNVYGNQKVIIPRKSKAQQSREERAKKARDQERAKMLAGIQRSVANSHASKVSVSAIEKKSPAAEIWENRNKEIVSKDKGFKGSPNPSHFIFEINIGKRRIRHRTTLKLNFRSILSQKSNDLGLKFRL